MLKVNGAVTRVTKLVSVYMKRVQGYPLNLLIFLPSDNILKVNDAVTKAMSLYMKRVQGVADENGDAGGGVQGKSQSTFCVCVDVCAFVCI